MALQTNAIVSRAEAKSFLTLRGETNDPLVEDVINAASDLCENELNRRIVKAVYANLRVIGPAGPKLYLGASPIDIIAPLTVKVGEIAQTVWKQESDGNPADFNVLVASDVPESPLGVRTHLYRVGGWGAGNGQPYNVLVSYTGGFNPVPSDLKDAVLYVVQKLYRDRVRQLTDVQTVTAPSGSITIFDIPMPRTARLIFDKYRWRPVG